jgi:DNA-binding CsgD family transcriptional regulator/tetratricopeptide (TPR) repeat protein
VSGLIERGEVLARLGSVLDDLDRGQGRVVVLTGPAGVGKTAVLLSAAQSAQRRGVCVLTARGGELEGEFSFGIARQLFEQLLARADDARRAALLGGAAARARLVVAEPLPASGAGDLSFSVVHGLYWLAVNTAMATPTLLVVDDAHWADPASLRWLLYLTGRVENLPLSLAMACRASEAGVAAWLPRLESVAEVVELEPLSAAGVHAFVAAAYQQEPDVEFTTACHGVTGGNPFLVTELVRALRADAVAPRAAEAAQVSQLAPGAVARAVMLRVGRLAPECVTVAQAAAVLGDDAPLRHVAALAGLSLASAASAVDQLSGSGILQQATPVRFRHSIVRASIYDDLPAAARSLRHAAAARLLAEDGASPDRVCAHLLNCEPQRSAEALQALRAAAGQACGSGAPESAVVYLRRALDETTREDERAAVFGELGRAEKLLRDPAAIAHLEQAVHAASEASERARAVFDLGEALILAGEWDRCLAVFDEAMHELPAWEAAGIGATDPALPMRLRVWWAQPRAFDPQHVTEFDAQIESLLAAASSGAPGARLLAASLSGTLTSRLQHLHRVEALLDTAIGTAGLVNAVETDSLIVSQALAALLFTDQLDRLDALIDEMLVESRATGSLAALAVGLCWRVAARTRRGNLVGAETDLRTLVSLASEQAMSFVLPSALWLGADAMQERRDLADVAALLAAIELPPDVGRTCSGAMLLESRARVSLADGTTRTAVDDLAAAGRIYEALHIRNPNTARWRSCLALAIAADDAEHATSLVDAELRDAHTCGVPGPVGVALRAAGMLATGDAALELLHNAVDTLHTSPAILELARAKIELGATLRRLNRQNQAREPLREGLDLAFRCGAQRLAARARTELLASGAKPRRLVLTGEQALTPSERRVAELASTQMSNPEIAQALFITLNTVEGHLRHVYRKLGITSRRDLAKALAAPAENQEPTS